MTVTSVNKTLRKVSAGALAAGLVALSAPLAVADDSNTRAERSDETIKSSAYYGPKKSVAVVDFSANGAFLSQYGEWSEGGGLAAMFESELKALKRFRVVNRSHLDSTLYEQELNVNGLTARPVASPGQLVGAQYIVRASVTDFTLSEKGGGISVGGNIGGVLGAISPRTQKGRISIDFIASDTTSGEVVASFALTKELKSKAIAASVSKSRLSVGGDTFKNTPLGKAARALVKDAAVLLARALEDKAWTAHVAHVRGDKLFVNAGVDSGLNRGDRLIISRVTDRIVDPMTGALLGVEKRRIGEAIIDGVAEQYATAYFNAPFAPAPGDLLTLKQHSPTALSLNTSQQ